MWEEYWARRAGLDNYNYNYDYTVLFPQSHFLASTEGDCLAGLEGWTGPLLSFLPLLGETA
jgi:hypothetical protein